MMYEQLFETKLAAVLVMLLSSMAIGAMVARVSLGLRSLIFTFAPSMSVAFFAVALFGDAKGNGLDLMAGLLFETLVLIIFIRLFADIYETLHRLDFHSVNTVLRWGLVVQLALLAPQLSLEGFGIFAEGSRISYLGQAAWAKYLTYAVVILNVVQAALLARLVTLRGGVTLMAWFVVLVNAANSLLSGSKGAVFLWIVSILALVDWRAAQLRWASITVFALVALAGLFASAIILSDVMGLDLVGFFDLAFNRFFLNNDARALAFDQRSGLGGVPEMARESFRSVAGLFGKPPERDPLGIVLYEELFGAPGDTGANASLTALATYYMPTGATALTLALAAAALLTLCVVGRFISLALGGGVSSLVTTIATLVCVTLYSQDFLAFQLAMPMVVLTVSILCVIHQCRSRPAPAVPRRTSGDAKPEFES